MPHPKILDKSKTALVVIDVQEAFRASIPEFERLTGQISTALRGCQILDVPVVVTEQYPKGLGRTAEEILLVLPDGFEPLEKTAFSSCSAAGFVEKLTEHGVTQIVLCGIETHVCVDQTAHDLLDQGFQVHLLTDAVGSRFEVDKKAGLEKMSSSGVVPSSVEMMFFELMGDAKYEQFKEIQKLVR
jgi:nicotinamidase-related amidase